MKGITAFALNNSRTVLMTIFLIVVGGIYAFTALPKLEDPLITIREAAGGGQIPRHAGGAGRTPDCPAHRRKNPQHG
jgi:hypothetical protein